MEVVVVGGLGSHGLGKIVFVNVFVVYQRCGALWFGFFVLFVFPKLFWFSGSPLPLPPPPTLPHPPPPPFVIESDRLNTKEEEEDEEMEVEVEEGGGPMG